MAHPQSFYSELTQREILFQTTSTALEEVLSKQSLTFYCGFDPTSDSLHVGSLLPLLTLRRFQRAGHSPIAVIGGATGMIGDPSGKSQERNLLSPEQIALNAQGIQKIIEKFVSFDGKNKATLVNNADWFASLSFVTFLREVGKYFTVNHMMAKESVRARLEDREHGISYTEFSYMLLQAYDFLELNNKYGCNLQIGGSDQWGNITAGCELIRKFRAVKGLPPIDVYGFTHPLVTQADGTKFGKTEKGTLWLDPKKTSPYLFYQFWLRTADTDSIRFLKYFSESPIDEIEAIATTMTTSPEKRSAQHHLARELTDLVHGEHERVLAEKATRALFEGDVQALDLRTFEEAFSEAPAITLPLGRIQNGVAWVELLSETPLFASKGAARKEVQAGGVYLNQERIQEVDLILRSEHLLHGRFLLLRKGKKNYCLVKVE